MAGSPSALCSDIFEELEVSVIKGRTVGVMLLNVV